MTHYSKGAAPGICSSFCIGGGKGGDGSKGQGRNPDKKYGQCRRKSVGQHLHHIPSVSLLLPSVYKF